MTLQTQDEKTFTPVRRCKRLLLPKVMIVTQRDWIIKQIYISVSSLVEARLQNISIARIHDIFTDLGGNQ